MTETKAAAFVGIAASVMHHARSLGSAVALTAAGHTITWTELGEQVDRLAAGLLERGLRKGHKVALLASLDVPSVIAFLAVLRAGGCVVPLSAYAAPEQLASMLRDSDSQALFCSEAYAGQVETPARQFPMGRWLLDGAQPGWEAATALCGRSEALDQIRIDPGDDFNLVYSSGTTSEPNGIVQSHGMRMGHVERARRFGYADDTVTLLSTPLSSNITTVALFATLAHGGKVVLQPKFAVAPYLELCASHRVTHTTLVPVQYERVLADPLFDKADLSAFRAKLCVGSPLREQVKRDILARWPGKFFELYSSTEGGVTCILAAHEHTDKLHTVGKPAPGNDVRMVDADGREVPLGDIGEIVGRSGTMMDGYYKRPDKTQEISWFDDQQRLYYRTGDIGRFDEDGFLVLLDRKKDMIITGGLNVYPGDIEAVLASHPAVAEASVVGVENARWGEVPVAFVRLRTDTDIPAGTVMEWANERLGKTQRLSEVRLISELPRSGVGKVLKRELRELYLRERGAPS